MNYIYSKVSVEGNFYGKTDPVKLVEAALKAVPAESQYAEMARDFVAWYRADPSDWEKTWQLCQKKYRENPAYQKASNGGIDCKINGAYVLLGLLYGQRDPDKTIVISMRGGQDSDCNPSSSAGVLFTTMGLANVPGRFTKELNRETIFIHTAYSFPKLTAVGNPVKPASGRGMSLTICGSWSGISPCPWNSSP